MKRHEMRKFALFLIFERMFNTDGLDEIIETAKECENIEVNNDVIYLFKGVEANKEALDDIVKKHLKDWTTVRISKISLAILRLAIFEIYFDKKVDVDIIISEAVKLAQEFTLQDDVSFINGVLSSVSKELVAAAVPHTV